MTLAHFSTHSMWINFLRHPKLNAKIWLYHCIVACWFDWQGFARHSFWLSLLIRPHSCSIAYLMHLHTHPLSSRSHRHHYYRSISLGFKHLWYAPRTISHMADTANDKPFHQCNFLCYAEQLDDTSLFLAELMKYRLFIRIMSSTYSYHVSSTTISAPSHK